MNYVDELKRLAGDVKATLNTQPSLYDWERTEGEMGFRIPSDYKELVSWFGAGRFGITIELRNPLIPYSADYNHRNYQRLALDTIGVWDRVTTVLSMSEDSPRFYPKENGLYFMGFAGDSAGFYYILNRSEQMLEDLYIFEGDVELLHRITSISEFIYKLYTGQCESKELREFQRPCWQEGDPLFTPLVVSTGPVTQGGIEVVLKKDGTDAHHPRP